MSHWREYSLLDCGNGKKLEQFGPHILIRPEPEAIWQPDMKEKDWKEIAQAEFVNKAGQKGKWEMTPGLMQSWKIPYAEPSFKLTCQLQFGKFKNIGLFPEQAPQWKYIHDCVTALPVKNPRVLNLFAHTGLASIVARKAGADVFHVEGLKTFMNWANQNSEINKTRNIRWVLEDVSKFIKRECSRKHNYHGIIADPPAFGMGPGKEKWVLEKHLPAFFSQIGQLLAPEGHFLIVNTYGRYIAPETLKTLAVKTIDPGVEPESGTLTLNSARDHVLTQSSYVRYRNF